MRRRGTRRGIGGGGRRFPATVREAREREREVKIKIRDRKNEKAFYFLEKRVYRGFLIFLSTRCF